MDMEQCSKCIPIPINEEKILSMAFDGCYYYLLLPCEIVKTDLKFHILCHYRTCREYSHLCYDWQEDIFWASSPTCQKTLYKLDCTMEEQTSVPLKNYNQHAGLITGISYECCCNRLMVSFEKTIARVAKNGNCNECLYMPDVKITGILCLCPGCVITLIKDCKQYIYIWPPDSAPRELYCVDANLNIVDLSFNPCDGKDEYLETLILPFGETPHVCKTPLSSCALGYHLWGCNYHFCKNCSRPTPPPPHPHFPPDCGSIIESIALEEAAIAHILNAEGEKIQKIVAITNDFDKIMCVNREVNETIINLTILEQTLYAKLVAISKICPLNSGPC